MNWPTAIDLFCGSGGLTLGLKQARFRVLGGVELDEHAASTFRTNHKTVHVWQMDIRELSVAEVTRRLKLRPGQLGLLAGCPPCQGFSSIRTRNGATPALDDRNDLVLQFVRFARGLRPRAIMLENVPGLAKDGRFTELCDELRELGYICRHRISNAAEFGVAQRRRRLILVAGRGRQIKFPGANPARPTVRDAIGDLPDVGAASDPLHDLSERRSERVLNLIRQIPSDGGSRRELDSSLQLSCHQEFDGFKDVYGRMAWDDVAPTITGGCVNPSKGRFLHPEAHRAITLREAALLQGFPPGYDFSLGRGKYAVAEMIGNALPPPLVAAHADEIRRALVETR